MPPPKTILLMCASGQLGGTEMRMLEEARLLKSLGHEATVCIYRFPQEDAFRAMLDEAGIAHTSLVPPRLLSDWRKRHVNWLKAELMARHELTRLKPDLVHVFFPWGNLGLDHLWLAGRQKVPSVVSVHNVFPPYVPSPWDAKHRRTAFRSLRGLYGVSNAATEHAGAAFGPFLPETARQESIYNFVDMARFRPSPEARSRIRQQLGVGPDTALVGSVGRLDKQKRPLHLVEVFSRVRARQPDSHLLLIGHGDLQADVEARIGELGLGGNVTILPFQKNIEDYFPAMDAHLLVSGNEGFGIVTAEAMACGTPAVGTNVTGTQEVLRGATAGRLPPLEDDDAVAAAVIDVLDERSKDPTAMAQAARDHVDRHFSRTQWAERIEAFYKAVLD